VVAEVRIGNREPEWISLAVSPANNVVPGTELVATPEARDPDGDALLYEYQWYVDGEPIEGADGASFSTEGLRRGDEVAVEVVLSDGEVELDETSGLVEIANQAPRIVSQPTGLGEELSFRYDVEVSDADGDRRFRYSLAKAPEGMTIGMITGEVRWDASQASVGRHEVEVVVDDMHGGEARQLFEVGITELVDDAGDQSAPAAPASAAPADGTGTP